MRQGSMKDGRECEIFESYAEVAAIAPKAPRFCDKDATELHYCSFYDSLNRYTLKAFCPKCRRFQAVSVKEEKYEAKMLERWTKLVKDRAGNKCEMADDKCFGELHAHHIIPKHLDPSKKYAVENGLCLCAAHHKMIHHYM